MDKPITATDVIESRNTAKNETMLTYGCLKDDIRFEQDGWALLAPVEGCDGLDCVHACNRKDLIGVHIQWCMQIISNPHCPGCGAVMPDEVQGLYQMANMDCPARIPADWIEQEIARGHTKAFAKFEEKLIQAFGESKSKLTRITA